MNLIWINPFTDSEDIIKLEHPEINASNFNKITNCNNDKDVINKLESILKELDCTRDYDCGRPMMTSFINYQDTINKYYYYILKLKNQFIYNKYIDKLIKRHKDNILFEYNNPYSPKQIGKSKRNSKKRTISNKFIKQKTIDMFTGEDVYIYTNSKTGQQYETNNPNLLNKINNKHKEKTNKKKVIPISSMYFNFKKK